MPDHFIGLMSGTSLDGIDAALVDFSSGVAVTHAATTPFEDDLRDALQHLIEQPESASLDDIARADAQLGLAYAAAVHGVLAKAQVPAERISAIGCHGQTIRHRPDTTPAFTWQIGDANRIAAATGIPVVADFRRMDMAVGGQGAPLVPAFHAAMFASDDELRVVVNIGGIANITRLGPTVTGYDTGPGNGLMDAWIQHSKGERFDRDGAWAASGKVNDELLATLSADPFFHQAPPRSTGREHFNRQWLLQHLSGLHLPPEDVQATLLALTVESIARELHRASADRVLLCGGGARNRVLREALATALHDIPVDVTDALGVSADFVEAAAFAWLARERLAGRPGNLPSVTGAGRPVPLGAVYLP
ncbi:MAG TPA: anhydro-N-acetylmuramic acid kinase [Gammaproteobacteria bacterium]